MAGLGHGVGLVSASCWPSSIHQKDLGRFMVSTINFGEERLEAGLFRFGGS
jgi:hypothetical protein